MTKSIWPLFPLLAIAVTAEGRTVTELCGTHPMRESEARALHRQNRALAARRDARLSPAIARDAGNIAILEDDGGIVARRNIFNLDRKRLAFSPVGPKYRYELSSGGYDAAAAASGALIDGLGDDDSRRVSLAFAFPYFGKQYRELYVNSDGNLTFGEPDNASSDRSLGRMTAGPPRIAPLFGDLDPSLAGQDGGVRVLSEGGRMVISWVAVPEYSDFGIAARLTFQVTLFSDGRIEFAWAGALASAAVVGIAPGALQGPSVVADFTASSAESYAGAVAERFGGSQEIDTVTAAQRFYETHEDAYDYLVFFNNMNIAASAGAIAYFSPVRNNRTGFGDPAIDTGTLYGSGRRLLGVMNMGQLTQYPADPNAPVPGRGVTGDSTLTILGHEAGHMFLAYVSVREPEAPAALPLLGRQLFHWNFRFNSEASLLEGNRIRDNGPFASPRFTTIATVQGYSALDQYLMGFRPAEEVPPTFYVKNATVSASRVDPQVNVSFDGMRRDVGVDEIISVAGRRTPDHTVAQRRFRFAFILIVPPGGTPSAAELAQVERYRAEFEGAYRKFSGDRAWADSSLRKGLRLSLSPAGGVLAGGAVTASIELAGPALSAMTVSLSAPGGFAGVPVSVTIPAGAARASFTARGLRAGVEELTAEPSGSSYETAYARVQVRAPGGTRLTIESGDRQAIPLADPVVFRLTDENNLPYAGVTIKALTGSGSLDAASAVTDADGRVSFLWTPGAAALVHEMTAGLDGGPAATVTAIGRALATPESIVNAASFRPGLAPGMIATVFGANLGGGKVTIGGRAAKVIFDSVRQLNFVVPLDVPAGSVEVRISTFVGETVVGEVRVYSTLPGVFAARNAGSGFVEIYATGLGVLNGAETMARPLVTIDSQPADLVFSGLAPGFEGLYQVNARLTGLGGGKHTVTVSVGGVASNAVAF